MTGEEFIKLVEQTFKECVDIVKKKNPSYANNDNRIANYDHAARIYGLDGADYILMRTEEKMYRIGNILRNGGNITDDESLEETLKDNINQLVFALLRLKGEI